MNGNHQCNNAVCNPNQISKNLPLKKRRAYLTGSSATNANSEHDENYANYSSTAMRQSYSTDDSLQIHLPSVAVPTPPSSPHIELLRQHYAHLLANSTNSSPQHLYPPPTTYECVLAQKLLAQQFLDEYRTSMEQQQQQYQNQQFSYTVMEDKQKEADVTIDEHFRKSLGYNYDKPHGGFLTPDTSSSNSSPIERTPADSIEEHFARSLGKFWPLQTSLHDEHSASMTESVVDDHFAKALGATTWEKLKEKS
ncbi:unnamed protein product [Adineta ricciae]|uniref:Uncharacterized protein n=1 Tax=Adineta ricciae TaxID=249248 RepID=A0A813PSJ9_ADIRI|nr:unnamed protein product [Adineta ricciae]CAF1398500.1 unnamed protein product [Adineta ricciae]